MVVTAVIVTEVVVVEVEGVIDDNTSSSHDLRQRAETTQGIGESKMLYQQSYQSRTRISVLLKGLSKILLPRPAERVSMWILSLGSRNEM